jgi:voltage-gated potassium channel
MDDLAPEAQALRKIPFFRQLTDRDLTNIAHIGHRHHYEPGQNIVERGEEGRGMFVIISGAAEVDVGGRFHRLEQGEFFGEMALVKPGRRSATVRAVEPTEALVIETMEFKPFLMQNPSLAVAILEEVVDRLREVQERIDAWMGTS